MSPLPWEQRDSVARGLVGTCGESSLHPVCVEGWVGPGGVVGPEIPAEVTMTLLVQTQERGPDFGKSALSKLSLSHPAPRLRLTPTQRQVATARGAG